MEENYGQTPTSPDKQKYSYGKRPLWQWVVIYVIVGGVAYALIYYLFLAKNGGYTSTSNPYNYSNTQSNTNTNQNTMNTTEPQALKIETLVQGSGSEAKSGDMVTVNYTGTLTDGTKFDSSLNPGRTPFQFTIDQSNVIQGWHLGVKGMKVGEKRKLTIPAELGYGAGGRPPVIPPNATLVFEIDLLKIN